MSSTLKMIFAVALIGMTASCGVSPNAPGVGGVTKGQAQELNQAADSLDQRTTALPTSSKP